MIVSDGYFLTEDTEDIADIINNLILHARDNSSCFLMCVTTGILESSDQNSISSAEEYFDLLLQEEKDLLSILKTSGYALLQFRSPYSAMQFAETYFFYKNEIDLPEKYVYCCVVDETGSIYMENLKSPSIEKATNITDVFTPEELEQQLYGTF